MGRLKSISGRVFISYLAVVLITFFMTALAFYPILLGVLEYRAQIGLEKQAWEIAFIVESSHYGLQPLPDHSLPATILLLGHSVKSNYMLVDPNNRITFSSSPQEFPINQILSDLPAPLRETQGVDQTPASIYRTDKYLAVEVPIGINPETTGTVITFVSTETLRTMYLGTLYLVLGNLSIALISALVIAYFLVGYIVRPLNNLEKYAEAVGNRQFDVKLEAKWGDELSTLALAFNQMAQRLKTYDDSMRHFFQNASHEMKTPLMSINGYAEGIRDGLFEGASLENAIEIIHKESLRLRNIVDNMIDITILEQPHSNYFLPHPLDYIVENVLDSVGGYALEQKVEIHTSIPANAIVVGDWDRLQSLFVNLLSNAVRHARSRVTLRAHFIPHCQQVKIFIEDDGSGFTPEDMEHGYDYFYTRAKEGSGLGLTIARIIVEEHKGTISLGNAPQQGAVVAVTLPSLKADKAVLG